MANCFPPSDDMRALVASAGIVNELLNMLKGGTTDLDLWQVGLKGLLALGLF